jgi:hypothetical protein
MDSNTSNTILSAFAEVDETAARGFALDLIKSETPEADILTFSWLLQNPDEMGRVIAAKRIATAAAIEKNMKARGIVAV